MEILAVILVFVFGTIIGSFLNVAIFRYNTNYPVGGRSKCLSCGRTLSWYELIPVFSYLIQGGKCRNCQSHVSLQYPLVELGTGATFVFLFKFLRMLDLDIIPLVSHGIVLSMIVCILIIIAAYDFRHKIIPDQLVYSFSTLSVLYLFLGYSSLFVIPSLGSLLAGPLLAAPFAALWLFSSGKYIGFGDAKLALGIGFLLGLAQGVAAMILAFWAGAFVGLLMIILSRRKVTFKSEVPFAPFMILGTLAALLFSLDIFSIASWFIF